MLGGHRRRIDHPGGRKTPPITGEQDIREEALDLPRHPENKGLVVSATLDTGVNTGKRRTILEATGKRHDPPGKGPRESTNAHHDLRLTDLDVRA